MADPENVLLTVARLIRALDEEALAALASKGLVRRAHKDLENGLLVETFDASKPDTIGLKILEESVYIGASGPAGASCSCPASGVCRHILLACLSVDQWAPADQPTEESTEARSAQPMESFNESDLKRWAGAETFRQGIRLLDAVSEIGDGLVTFLDGVQCHWVPAGFDALICNAEPRKKNAYRVAACLTWLRAQGVALELPGESGMPPMDMQLLERAQRLISDAIVLGINHLPQSFGQNFRVLSVACRVNGLVRPALELESCAQEIEWIDQRHALADSARLFEKLARLAALLLTLQNQGDQAEMVYRGQARSRYQEMGHMALVGMGAYPWETDSGYQGLTCLFWAPNEQAFFSWSESRPKNSADGFHPRKRYEEGSPWPGGGLLVNLCQSFFTLNHPKTNELRRLSAWQSSTVENIRPIAQTDLPPPYADWSELLQQQEHKMGLGLKHGIPLDALCLLQPKIWHPPQFDEKEQALIIQLEDEKGAILPVILPFSSLTQAGIFYLERNRKPEEKLLLAHLSHRPALRLFPIACLAGEDRPIVQNILFQPMPEKTHQWFGFKWKVTQRTIPYPQDSDAFTAIESLNPLTQVLSPLDDFLLALAERGFRPPSDSLPAIPLEDLGFTRLANQLKHLDSPQDLLLARYTLHLIQSAAQRLPW